LEAGQSVSPWWPVPEAAVASAGPGSKPGKASAKASSTVVWTSEYILSEPRDSKVAWPDPVRAHFNKPTPATTTTKAAPRSQGAACPDPDLADFRDLVVLDDRPDFGWDFPPDLRRRRELLKARLNRFKSAVSLGEFPSGLPCLDGCSVMQDRVREY